MKVVVALFNINTQAMQYMSAASRINHVSAAVESAKGYTEGLGTAFWKDMNALRAIFLAPEYCFARSLPKLKGDHGFGDKRQMDEDHVKNNLRPVFAKLSLGFKNALIVPGSVAWRKSIIPKTDGKHGTPQQTAEYRRDKYAKRLQDSAKINMDYNNNPKFSQNTTVFPNDFKRRDDPRVSVDTIGGKIAQLQTAHYIAKNTAHCYYNGNEVYKYNKIGDFYEVANPTGDAVNMPNSSKVSGTTVGAGRFSVAGFDFGISICYDQSLSVQDSSVQVKAVEPLQHTQGPVFFHILLSAQISPQAWAANLYNDGYLLSCSSAQDCTLVLKQSGAVVDEITAMNINNVGTLFLYQIDI